MPCDRKLCSFCAPVAAAPSAVFSAGATEHITPLHARLQSVVTRRVTARLSTAAGEKARTHLRARAVLVPRIWTLLKRAWAPRAEACEQNILEVCAAGSHAEAKAGF